MISRGWTVRCWVALSVVLLVLAPALNARAYRTLADDPEFAGEPVVWGSSSLQIEIAPGGLRGFLTTDVHERLRRGAFVWTQPECTDLSIVEVGVSDARAESGDGLSLVDVLRSGWGDLGLSPDVAATTDLLFARDDGGAWRIIEADILLNAEHHEWSLNPQTADSGVRDLQATLTHELGHRHGVAHPCSLGAGTDPGAPTCDGDLSFLGSVMYPGYLGAEQASLGNDDVAAICVLYPASTCRVSCGSGEVCEDELCRALCGDSVCRGDESCVDGGCTAEPCEGPDCPPSCAEGGCGAPGDPCTTAAECLHGACGPQGCTSACDSDAECGADGCVDGVCVLSGRGFGDSCEVRSDCLSQLCLDSAGDATCTRECGDRASCPEGHVCGEVEGRSVCRPQGASACGIAPGSSPSRTAPIAFFAALALLTLRRTR